ncbi:MAG: 2-oxoacid:acceptor oxidoreductase family protein [Firmicutes bacterium]|nr:2-oxoacid:acceptor oxidoreductase family protein [Bacillota bacterium]
MTTQYLLAGFGGQGVLFAGKFLAYLGLTKGKQVSWLPSYGPEMRGGTANCSVIISDDPVGSPIVNASDVLVALNLPSLDKFESAAKPGSTIFVDSTLIGRKVNRADVCAVYVPATQLASDNGMASLANIIMMGKVLAAEDEETVKAALVKAISAKRADMIELNMKAFRIGKSQ